MPHAGVSNMSKKSEKPKKEKIVYIDDGRTLADMSNVSGGWFQSSDKMQSTRFRDSWRTYWQVFRMMLVPTAIAVGILVILFLLASVVLRLAY